MRKKLEELISVRKKGQVTLPLSMRKVLRIEEGSVLMSKIVDDAIVLVPQEVVDRDQAWFWKDRWQKLEADAEKDISAGRTKTFDSVEDLFHEIEGTAQADPDRTVQKKRA
jgi:bifunctional DNA-binding transcriptional regulator/antitoxin component of YhaV-PrlF toxin-antitoxin module